MGQINIQYFPWLSRMQNAPEDTGERVEIALTYIDFVVATLLRCYKQLDAESIKKLLEAGESNWGKLVDKNLVVMIDPDDDCEQFLDRINYPEFFIKRVLESAQNDEQYKITLNIARNFAKFMGWGDLEIIEELNEY